MFSINFTCIGMFLYVFNKFPYVFCFQGGYKGSIRGRRNGDEKQLMEEEMKRKDDDDVLKW